MQVRVSGQDHAESGLCLQQTSAKTMASGFTSRLYCHLAVWLRVNDLTSLCLRFLNYLVYLVTHKAVESSYSQWVVNKRQQESPLGKHSTRQNSLHPGPGDQQCSRWQLLREPGSLSD